MKFNKHQVDTYYNHLQQQVDFPVAYTTELFLIGKITQDTTAKQAIETVLTDLLSKEGLKAFKSRTKIPITGKHADYEKTLRALISFGKKATDLALGKMFLLLGYDSLILTKAPLIKKVNENLWFFGRLDGVKEFSIWDEAFPSGVIPEEIGDLKTLEELEIRGMYKTLPDSIGNLQQLKKLEIRLSNLDVLPESMQRLTQLEELGIAGGGFSRNEFNKQLTLPSWISNFKQLKTLEMGYLTIPEIPEDCFPPQLEALRIYRMHHITALPESIGDLHLLKSFELYVCDHITALPQSMTRLRHLQVLEMGSLPQLKSLDGNLIFAPNIQKLRLIDGVDITEPQKEVNTIKKLVVRNTAYLKHLVQHPELFPELETLKINEIRDWDLPEGLNGLPKLQTLSVWYLGDVPALFRGLATCPQLQHLEINNSDLTSLPDLRSIKQLSLFKIHYCPHLHLCTDHLPERIDRLDATHPHTFTFGKWPMACQTFRISSAHLEHLEAMGQHLDAQSVSLSLNDQNTIDGKDVLDVLPMSIGLMKNLREFTFQGKVAKIDDCFHTLEHLESLSLSGLSARYRSNGKACPIKDLAPLQLPNLQRFYLSDYAGNQLEAILHPLEKVQLLSFRQLENYKVLPVATMTNLEELHLYQCGFSDLSQVVPTIQVFEACFCDHIGDEAVTTVCTWPTLKKLSLKYISKAVTELPEGLQQLPLSHLGLRRLNLSEIPAFIGYISTLETLYLDGFHVEGLPLSMADLPHLKYLSIDSTTFKQPLPKDFQRLRIKELRMFLSKFAGNNMREELYATLLTPGLTKIVKEFSTQ